MTATATRARAQVGAAHTRAMCPAQLRKPHAALSALAASARDVARLIVPVQCPGCGMEDVRWCEPCAALWWEPPWRCEGGAGRLCVDDRPPLPVWAVSPLEGPAHAMVGAWKDGHRRDLDTFFADAAARAAHAVAPALAEARVLGQGAIAVVPLPSRPASVRRRGADLPGLVATAVAGALTAAGVPAQVHRALRIGAGEQRGAGVRERWRRALQTVRAAGPAPRDPVVLVDDVVTTGATMAAATAALEAAGGVVCAGLALAARGR